MRIEVAGGVELEWQDHGGGDRPFVLVHGFTGASSDFDEHLPDLARVGRTLAPDLRGHGASTNTGDASSYTLDRLKEDVLRSLDALEVDRCDLLGHSMGGMVALRLVLDHPDRVASLVLMDTSASAIELVPRAILEGSARVAREGGMGVLARAMRDGARKRPQAAPSTLAAWEAMGFDAWWDRIEGKLEAMDPIAFEALAGQLADQEPVAERLGEIRCPTTVLYGEEDAPFVEPSREMAESIPSAVLVPIPDAAHSPQLENPLVWLETIRAHLERARA